MTNFTTDVYETKRDIINFSSHLSQGISKTDSKFVMDIQFGLASSQSVLITDIARALQEDIKPINVVDRLCDRLYGISDDAMNTIKANYYTQVVKVLPSEPLILLDDSEIVKSHGRKFEDLCMVRDASATKETLLPGYHVCEATAVSENEKQPISLYSKIYSTESDGFVSKNEETLKSIEAVKAVIPKKCTFVADRGYDANIYFNYFLNEACNDDFVIRLKENRNLLFKKKAKNVGEIAKSRKGKIRMNMFFRELDKETYISHTRVELPSQPGKALTLVIVYGLSEEKPMMLLTNKNVSGKKDVIRVVRAYMSRWRIEENFRFKKQQYGFEGIRVRTLKALNNLNTMLMIQIGYIGLLAEKVDKKLLVIKIIERSRSIKSRACFWFYQISKGIKYILSYAHTGIKEYQMIECHKDFEQLTMRI